MTTEGDTPRWLYLAAALVAVFLVVPILIVIPMSFSSGSYLEFPPPGWSTQWYENFFTDDNWSGAALTSAKIAFTTAFIATILGTAAALGLERGRFRGKSAIWGLVLGPMVVPVVIIAVALFSVFIRWQLSGSFGGLVLGHTVLALPFVVITVAAGVRTLDPALERAAASLGANPWRVFSRVTLPILAPNIAIGALFAFITSWDEVVVSVFLSDPVDQTLPVVMFTQLETSLDPTIAAAATMLIVVTTTLLVCSVLVRTLTERRRRTF